MTLLGVSMENANASHHDSKITPTFDQSSDDWVFLKKEEGVKVYLSKHHDGDQTFVKIKFENTINKMIEIDWSLTHDDKELISNQTNKIQSLNSIEIFDATMLVPVSGSESLNNFSISIVRN